MITKRCTKCGLPKPLDRFSRNASNSDGLQRWCKQCSNAASKALHPARPTPSLAERLQAKTQLDPGGCWLWTGAKVLGYGKMEVDGRQLAVHRLAYQLHVGAIPAGCDICHTCARRDCLNPGHLTVISRSERVGLHNRQRAAQSRL